MVDLFHLDMTIVFLPRSLTEEDEHVNSSRHHRTCRHSSREEVSPNVNSNTVEAEVAVVEVEVEVVIKDTTTLHNGNQAARATLKGSKTRTTPVAVMAEVVVVVVITVAVDTEVVAEAVDGVEAEAATTVTKLPRQLCHLNFLRRMKQ